MWNKSIPLLFLAVVFILSLSVVTFSQQGMMKGKMGGEQGRMMYDTNTVETISGEVVSIDKIQSGRGMSGGIHIKIKTARETISVHLGPAFYIEKQSVKINIKDIIEVTGSRVLYGGESVIIAAELKKNGKILKLRDSNGVPLWSGRGNKNR